MCVCVCVEVSGPFLMGQTVTRTARQQVQAKKSRKRDTEAMKARTTGMADKKECNPGTECGQGKIVVVDWGYARVVGTANKDAR